MVSVQKSLNNLFVSKVRIKSLKYFFRHQDSRIHLRAVARELREEINAVRRELLRLHEIKLLKVEKKGNKKYFSLNFDFPMYEELNSIFLKSEGLGEQIIKSQSNLGTIYFVALTSSYVNKTRLSDKDIDMIVIGDVDLNFLTSIVHKQEEELGREIHFTVLQLSEFNLRKKRRDPFIINFLLQTRVMLVGNRDEFVS